MAVSPEIIAFSEETRRTLGQLSAPQRLLPTGSFAANGLAPELSGVFGSIADTLAAANQPLLVSARILSSALTQSLALQPMFDQSWLRQALGVDALIKESADSLSRAILPLSNLRWVEPSLATPVMSRRLLELSNSFNSPLSGTSAPFGKLHELMSADSAVANALDRAVGATQVHGSFGFDANGLRRASTDLTSLLESRPSMQEEIEAVWPSVQEESGLTDELLFDFTNTLGLIEEVRSHRPTGPAVVVGFTVGLLAFVAGAASISDTPTSLVTAATTGGAIYYFVNKSITTRRSD